VERVRALEGELALPVKHIVANMVLPTLFAEQERPLLEGAAARSGMSDESVHVVLRAARGRCMREALQRTCIARLNAELDKPLLTVPLRLPPPSHAKKVQ
jgi:methylphosphotriester-DNA--protein-cysteine methyltransferase